ncbi:MAG: ATP-binding protein [Cytophagia bacterium]|nr:ATP-binding protein [Cytophagia bacterium]NBW35985.1 ATP-binding protein [Cytophagia bacterium]
MFKIQEAQPYDPQEIKNLRKLVSRGEGLHLEFKRKANHPLEIVKEFIAFANAQGGTLIVGVEDDGTIYGVKHAEGDTHAIAEAVKFCKPVLQINQTLITLSDSRIVIRYDIPESKQKPHYLKCNEESFAYVRVVDRCMKASSQMCEVLKRAQKASGIKFTYGEQEQVLMQYLELHHKISLKECARLLKINTWKASRKLVLLTLADVLQIVPTEKGDFYMRK